MRLMGLEAVYPKPHLSAAGQGEEHRAGLIARKTRMISLFPLVQRSGAAREWQWAWTHESTPRLNPIQCCLRGDWIVRVVRRGTYDDHFVEILGANSRVSRRFSGVSGRSLPEACPSGLGERNQAASIPSGRRFETVTYWWVSPEGCGREHPLDSSIVGVTLSSCSKRSYDDCGPFRHGLCFPHFMLLFLGFQGFSGK